MKAQSKGILLVILVLALFSIFFFSKGNISSIGLPNRNWQKEYLLSVENKQIEKNYYTHDSIINTNEEMSALAKEISKKSINTKDAVKNTLNWVYENIKYTKKTTAQECYLETSVDVFNKGVGDCVSMSKVAISLLRSQGIVARPVGGCISSFFSCNVLFSIFPERQPRFEPVDPNDPKKRGGLHEWIEIWFPEEGWIIGEVTSGQLYSKTCKSYSYHDYNSDSIGMCVISDTNFVDMCKRF